MDRKEKIVYKRRQEQEKAEIARIHIYNDFLAAVPRTNIRERLMTDYYNIGYAYSERTAYLLIADVSKRIMEDFDAEMSELSQALLTRYLDLYHQAYMDGNRYEAKQLLDSISKLTGANAAQRIDMKVDNNVTIDFNFEDED